MITLRYKKTDVPNFDALIDQPFNLKSPCRSTAPLLAYWADSSNRFAHLGRAIAAAPVDEAIITFESEVPVPQGVGNPSCTDIMIETTLAAIAVEAKYTERHYKPVSKWLGESPTENRQWVLDGWLYAINKATGSDLNVADVQEITYQMLHRTASVCIPEVEMRAVVCQIFYRDEPISYRAQLCKLAKLIGPSMHFYVFNTLLKETCPYKFLREKWESKKDVDFSGDVRGLLQVRNVATFETMTVLPVDAQNCRDRQTE